MADPTRPAQLRLVFEGDFDLVEVENRESAVQRVLDDPPRVLEVDLTEVTFIGSEALRLLIRVYAAVVDAGGEFRITGASPVARRLLRMTDLTDTLGLG